MRFGSKHLFGSKNSVGSKKLAVFDHLPKTAGSSIATWANRQYGAANSVWFRHELHSNLVKNYSHYRVVSGHTYFEVGESLSENCRYLTVLREPVDRVISWLYFAMSHDTDEMAETKSDCARFLNGSDADLCHHVTANITNNYIDHFCKIDGTSDCGEQKQLSYSLDALEKYDVVGLYEDLPAFTDQFCKLVKPNAPRVRISRENATKYRPGLKDVPAGVVAAIKRRNESDLELYDLAVRMATKTANTKRFFFRF